jgi:dipeptidase
MARNEDSGAGQFTPKKFIVVRPEDQPRHYKSVLSKVEIDLPDNPMRYTAVPNALPDEGIWGEAGINEANVAMSETETITSNARVLGADPLVRGGIGEEDLLTIVLPYIRSAREGVLRLGGLLEQYGTYEMNGIGFQDADEIWWLESIGGHHWIAKRVPDDSYVVMPNQQGIDWFDLADAFGERREHLCSADLIDFIADNHLDLMMDGAEDKEALRKVTDFDARAAFGSHDDADHAYNTARAWYMGRTLNPRTYVWDGPDADFRPESNDILWSFVPENRITVEDVKYVLSAHYQGTPFDPYSRFGDPADHGRYRSIGINRNNFVAVTQIRPYLPEAFRCLQWIAMGSNVFNAFAPFYANVDRVPEYLANTTATVSTESFYWANRLIGALADAQYDLCKSHIERYQNLVANTGTALLHRFDREAPETDAPDYLAACNEEICRALREATDTVLGQVLYETSLKMKNGYSRADA